MGKRIMNITSVPITAKPLTAVPLRAKAIGAGDGGGAEPSALVWAAAGSEYMFTGAGSHELEAEHIGVGDAPTFTNSALLLPDSDGVYVNIGANSPTWHGARWDGSTPYSSDSGGSPLSVMPSLYAAPAKTNELTYSNDLTNAAWTASNVTVAKDDTGLTGAANSGCTLTATAGNGTVIHSAITAASGGHLTRWFIKRKTGTGTIEITLDNGTTWQDVTSSIDTSNYNPCFETLTVTNPQIGIRIVTSGDAVYVANAEGYTSNTEAQITGLAPIVTAGSTVTTSAVVVEWDYDNHDNTQGAYYFENLYYQNTIGAYGTFLAVDGLLSGGFIITQNYWPLDRYRVSSNVSGIDNIADKDVFNRCAIAYEASSTKGRWNTEGTWGTLSSSFTGWSAGTTIEYGNILANNAPLLLRNLRRYDLPYEDAESKIDELMA